MHILDEPWIKRRKRRLRRQSIARFTIYLFLLFGLGAASVEPEHALLFQINRVTAAHRFDFVAWETESLSEELIRRWWSVDVPNNEAEQQALVQTFLDQEQAIRDLGQELDIIYAQSKTTTPSTDDIQPLETRLAKIKAEKGAITSQVEAILVEQVEAVLYEEGFRFTFSDQVFTPLAFRFIDPPTALIISPRDKIENIHFTGLQPGLEHSLRTEIENTLAQRGDVSSYVTNVGGLGSYPTMVVSYPYLPWLIETIAHEWTHNYLFSFPTNVAWGYQTYPRLRTINETTADIVGKEISRKVITRFYPDWVDQLPPLDETGLPAPSEPSEFDIAMRRIRQHVDTLLAEGKIEEAEMYMESERLKLVDQGYKLRKLNQAYFAFHGAYALSPASVDPTGVQLRQLRAKNSSLKAFVDQVGWLNSYDSYLAWLEKAGLE